MVIWKASPVDATTSKPESTEVALTRCGGGDRFGASLNRFN
jgi:hypothetical protein